VGYKGIVDAVEGSGPGTTAFEVWVAFNLVLTAPRLFVNGTERTLVGTGTPAAPTGATFVGGYDATPASPAAFDLVELVYAKQPDLSLVTLFGRYASRTYGL
jgi:hypothetical protein